MQECRDIDFFGIFLFTAGLLLFIMGLSWGGVQYPWKSAHVISTIVIGFCTCVAFVLYGMAPSNRFYRASVTSHRRALRPPKAAHYSNAPVQKFGLFQPCRRDNGWRYDVLFYQR